MRRRTPEEIWTSLGRIETSIAAVEQATTRLRFALARLPEDDNSPAHGALLDTLQAFDACIAVLLEGHKLALWDLDAVHRRRGAARDMTEEGPAQPIMRNQSRPNP